LFGRNSEIAPVPRAEQTERDERPEPEICAHRKEISKSMKPCSKNRKLLAWLALGHLDAGRATILREHLATCDGCRCYLEGIAKVTARISAAEMKADIVATEFFSPKSCRRCKGGRISHCATGYRRVIWANFAALARCIPDTGWNRGSACDRTVAHLAPTAGRSTASTIHRTARFDPQSGCQFSTDNWSLSDGRE
jgi:anti-sigma factor RsiW